MIKLPFTIRQLEVFAALSETQSFRGCAEILGISQASVSSQIKCLEDQLGTKLFVRRSGKRPSLTTEGYAFLKDLREFGDAGAKLARHRRQAVDREEVAVFRILVGQAMMDRFIKPHLTQFLTENPTVECMFEARPPSSPEDIVSEIETGKYEYALFHLRDGWPLSPGMRCIARAPGGVYGHKKFAEGKRLPLDLEELNELPFIFAAVGSKWEKEMMAGLSRRGIKPRNIVGHTQYFDVVASMIEQGIGVAPILSGVFDPDKANDIVMLHPTENWQLVSYNKHSLTDPRANALEEFMTSSVIDNPLYPKINEEPARQPTELLA